MERFRLDLIGPFGLFGPDGARIEITSKKAIALIALIVSSPGGVRSRRWLETMLWETRETAQAQTSLRRELANLAKQLDNHGAGHLLIRGMQRVGVASDLIDVDIFGSATAFAVQHRSGASFLEGLDLRDCEAFEDWLRDERERYDGWAAAALPAERLAAPADILGVRPPSALDVLADTPLGLPPKPSLAVLPFDELRPAADGWLGAAIADEIGVLLSRFPQLFIVAGASARQLAAQGLTRAAIAARLGVRYLLDGTVLRDDDRLRVSVQLIDGGSGEQVWAEVFHGTTEGFALQNEIAVQVAPQIWTSVDCAERRRTLGTPRPATDNYELYWRANALFRSWRKDHVVEAMATADRLVANDPTCPWAASLAAYCHSLGWLLHHAPDLELSRRSAIRHCQTALRYGGDNVEALGYAAGTQLNLGGDMAVADRLVAHALTLLPAHQPALFWGGWIDIARGESRRARERFEMALRINPASGVRSQTLCGIGFADLIDGDHDSAARLFGEVASDGSGFMLATLGSLLTAAITGDRAATTVVTRVFGDVPRDVAGLFGDPRRRDGMRTALRAMASESWSAVPPSNPLFHAIATLPSRELNEWPLSEVAKIAVPMAEQRA